MKIIKYLKKLKAVSSQDGYGFLDGLENQVLLGWAYKSNETTKRLEVAIYLNDILIDTTVADYFRSDLKSKNIGDGKYGFRYRLDSEKNYNGVFTAKVGGIQLAGEVTINQPAPVEIKKASREDLKYHKGVIDFFDNDYYVKNYPDVAHSTLSPLDHYMHLGWKEERNPNEIFNTSWYLETYPDVKAANINPFLHYVTVGWRERRDPSELFETKNLLERFKQFEKGNSFEPVFIHSSSKELQHLSQIIEPSKYKSGKDYVELTSRSKPPSLNNNKLIAFYLTQFHPIKENDENWGKGFTEWFNVSKASPQFFDHYQPHLPGEFGYYDLRLPSVMERQIELARHYGVHGFCFYYYWFSGKRLLEKPFDMFLNNAYGKLDFPFMIMWANENWTKRWDGDDSNVIIAQKHKKNDAINFIKDVEKILLDERYIKIDGKPFISIYKPKNIPDFKNWVEIWRSYWKEKHDSELYIAICQIYPDCDPKQYDCDGMMQFPPNGFALKGYPHKRNFINAKHTGRAFNYNEIKAKAIEKQVKSDYFKTSFPSWDNEARRPGDGDMFIGANEDKFRNWILNNIEHAKKSDSTANISFINAWNEWAEGAHLEPDLKYGYSYLQACADALTISSLKDSGKLITKRNDKAVSIHLFYPELIEEFKNYLTPIINEVDLFITINEKGCSDTLELVQNEFPNAVIIPVPNLGRDVRPFLISLKLISDLNYDLVLKLHSKKSLYRGDGDSWRRDLVGKLLNPKNIKQLLNLLNTTNLVGMIGPEDHVVDGKKYLGGNKKNINKLIDLTNISARWKSSNPPPYFAGTMFWCKVSLLKPLLNEEIINSFEPERNQQDGTMAHAIERFFPFLIQESKCSIYDTGLRSYSSFVTSKYKYSEEEPQPQPAKSIEQMFIGQNNENTVFIFKDEEFVISKPQLEIHREIKKKRKVAIFAMYKDNNNENYDFRIEYLKFIKNKGYYIICVNPSLGTKMQSFPYYNYVDVSICRYNKGYDFGSWILGMKVILDSFLKIENLLLFNDSVLGPIKNFNFNTKDSDVYALSDSHQFEFHLQSYFLLFSNKVINSGALTEFINSYKYPEDKMGIIFNGEILLSKILKKHKFTFEVGFPYEKLILDFKNRLKNQEKISEWENKIDSELQKGTLNQLHYFPLDLIKNGYPFIKKDILKNNPHDFPYIEKLIGMTEKLRNIKKINTEKSYATN